MGNDTRSIHWHTRLDISVQLRSVWARRFFSPLLVLWGLSTRLPQCRLRLRTRRSGNWKTAQPSDQNLGGNWWEIFQDPQLNALEQQIDVSNQNLKAAVAQYQQARAALRYARADYYPTVTAAPSATRERYSDNRPPQVQPVTDNLQRFRRCPSISRIRSTRGVASARMSSPIESRRKRALLIWRW